MKDIPNVNENIHKFKLNLSRFHSIFVSEGGSDHKMMSNEQLMTLKQEIFEELKKNNLEKIIENLLEIRLNGLKTRAEERVLFLKKLIEIDIFNIKNIQNEENIEGLEELLSKNNHTLNTCLLSLISMLLNIDDGISYLFEDEKKNEFLSKICTV